MVLNAAEINASGALHRQILHMPYEQLTCNKNNWNSFVKKVKFAFHLETMS